MKRESQKKAQKKFVKEHYVQFNLRLHRTRDADILHRLDQQANKQGYLKGLVRKDIQENGN